MEGLTSHELPRNTPASLAVTDGVNVKGGQRTLDHASAAMTLDVYSGLLRNDLDEVARRLDRDTRVHEMCTDPQRQSDREAAKHPDLREQGAALGSRTPDLRITSASL